jgi:hypothetical protein
MTIQKKSWSSLYNKDLSKCQCSINVYDNDYPINIKSIQPTDPKEKVGISDGSDTITGSYIIVENNTDQELSFVASVFLLEREVANLLNKSFEDDEEITLNIFDKSKNENQAITCYLKKLIMQETIEQGGTNNVNTNITFGTMDRKAYYGL